jgi:hypothetical protein
MTTDETTLLDWEQYPEPVKRWVENALSAWFADGLRSLDTNTMLREIVLLFDDFTRYGDRDELVAALRQHYAHIHADHEAAL